MLLVPSSSGLGHLVFSQRIRGSNPLGITYMNKISSAITDIEKKWLNLLYEYCKKEFSKVNLASHDHTHHRRVWNYAKQIFIELESIGYKVNVNNIEKSIIAIFFHDVGLTRTINEIGHGVESRKLCSQFFRQNLLKTPENFEEVLKAIEKHDDKEYKSIVYSKKLNRDNIMSILCVSDDLDAFGELGTLRYAEIYLLRDNNLKTLPERVIKNLDKRFQNFLAVYGDLKNLVKKQKKRYLLTKQFYINIRKEINV